MSSSFLTKIDLNFVQIEIYKRYALLTIKDDVLFDLPKLEKLFEVFDEYYPEETFGYISNRKFAFSVNPICYIGIANHPRLRSIAIFCHKKSTFTNAQFEKAFYKRPFGVFYTLEECEHLVNSHL